MVIKNLTQGVEVEAGKCIYHVTSEGGQALESGFPPVQTNFAKGSTWTDTTVTEGSPLTVRYILGEVEETLTWVVADPMTLTEDKKLYDVSGINHVYVEIEE